MKNKTIILLMGLLIILGLVIRIAIYPLFVANKAVDTAYVVTNKTLKADNVIYNYEWFKSQHQAIEAQKEKFEQSKQEYNDFVDTLPTIKSEWTKFDKQEEASLRNSKAAQEKILTDLIAEYNAKSSMANRAIFKDNDLPELVENK